MRDDTAIVRAFLGTGDVIARVDLRHPDGYLESELGDHGGTITLVSSAGSGSRPSTGSFDGTLLTQGAADGSVVVYAAPRGSNSAQFRIAGDRLLGPARWPLTARTRIAGGDAAASAPLMIDRDFEPPALHAVADRGGARKVVLGGVTDTRCSPSRDPLSTSADQFALDPSGVAMDRAGRIWVAAYPSAHSAGSGVLVVDHGVLRHLDLGRVATVTALADGSMLVSDEEVGGTMRRVTDPAIAHAAAPLPPIAPGCVSDNRVDVHTAGAQVRRLSPVGDVAARLDPDGRALVTGADLHALRLAGRTVYRTGHPIVEVTADGRGGAWWLEEGTADTVTVGRVSASGRARVLQRGQPATHLTSVSGVADRVHDSLWWSADQSWYRTSADGHTEPLAGLDAYYVAIGGGRRYGIGPQGVDLLAADGTAMRHVLGAEHGRGLSLAAGVAAHARPEEYSLATGVFAATTSGDLLAYAGGYLASVSPRGAVELLAGPAEGLPATPPYYGALLADRARAHGGVVRPGCRLPGAAALTHPPSAATAAGSQSARKVVHRCASSSSPIAAAARASACRARRKPRLGSCDHGTGPDPRQPARRSASSPRW